MKRAKSLEEQTASLQARAADVEKQLRSLTVVEQDSGGASALDALSETRRVRAVASLVSSPAEIASEQGRSVQAVRKSLAAPAVKLALRELIARTTVKFEDEEPRSLRDVALHTLGAALFADKAIVYGGNFSMVPDYATRVEAALKIIALDEDGRRETTATEETVTIARRRSARSR